MFFMANPLRQIANPDRVGTGRDRGFDLSSVAAPNAEQGRAATMLDVDDSG